MSVDFSILPPRGKAYEASMIQNERSIVYCTKSSAGCLTCTLSSFLSLPETCQMYFLPLEATGIVGSALWPNHL